MSRLFTSDLHLGHRNIIDYCGRPYGDVEEMNADIIRRWNKVVKPDDDVIVLGDVAMGKIAETLPLVGQLNGYKTLVPGNHDRCWRGSSKWEKWQAPYLEVFHDIWHIASTLVIGVEHVLLDHFPYEGDSHDDDRFEEHRPVDRGQWLLHGHIHEKWMQRGRQINVGLDAWNGYPVPESTIQSIIEDGPNDFAVPEW